MNLVDVLKGQLAGEVGKKLGGMLGANESDMGKILGAGLPALLSGLGSLASSKGGADKLADAIGKMDSGGFGDLGKMLGGEAMGSGGSLLGGLMGGSLVDGIAAAISKFTGINASMVKMALGYLTPLVLGSVGASFKGGKVDAAGISKLFSEQKSNIASAMPTGLSLDNIPGFQSLASNVAKASASVSAPAESSGGVGKLLVPLLLLVAAIAAVFFFLRGKPAGDAPSSTVPYGGGMSEMVEKAGDVESIKSGMASMMDGLVAKLDGVKDAAGAEVILPDLKDSIGKLEGMSKGISALPTEGKAMMAALVKSQLDKLNPIIAKIAALPGIGEAIKQVLEQLKEKLTGMVG